ncbi:hypothetical protein RND71_028825 [Anisodus tanguticus]|uniref:Uncharacterized protein n=1 Tax=Anisodus tanguticus TaxID=243964 RepID=A0AAE1RLQ6_9SOLA|nr:hypothetical protein RND71_028825 [Anisodus tanguticus]
MANLNENNRKSWMEVAIPAVLVAPKRISISSQLETIFEEDDFDNIDFYDISSRSGNFVLFPKVLSSLKLK